VARFIISLLVITLDLELITITLLDISGSLVYMGFEDYSILSSWASSWFLGFALFIFLLSGITTNPT
jgi:hypothetical protein